MLAEGWKKTGVQPATRTAKATAARLRMSEVHLEGEGAGVEAAVRFTRSGEVDAQRHVPPEGDAVLHADAGRRVPLSQELLYAARVGVDAPARRRIGERADASARADRIAAVELVMQLQGAFGERIHHCAMASALPGCAGAAVDPPDE